MRKSLPNVQTDFSDIVCLAIHENHPILPGYINKEVPSGISDYTPGKNATKVQLNKGSSDVEQETNARLLFDEQALHHELSLGC